MRTRRAQGRLATEDGSRGAHRAGTRAMRVAPGVPPWASLQGRSGPSVPAPARTAMGEARPRAPQARDEPGGRDREEAGALVPAPARERADRGRRAHQRHAATPRPLEPERASRALREGFAGWPPGRDGCAQNAPSGAVAGPGIRWLLQPQGRPPDL